MVKRVIPKLFSILTVALLGIGLLPLATADAAWAQENEMEVLEELDPALRFDAQAINMSNIRRGSATARFNIVVNRWSSDGERNALLEALKVGSRRSLPDALASTDRVGTIRESTSRAEFLRYSRRFDQPEGGQRIVLAMDRPMAFAEVQRSFRTQDYNVTLIVIDLNAEGEGEGNLFLGAEIAWSEEKQQIEVTGLATEPIRLTRVRRR